MAAPNKVLLVGFALLLAAALTEQTFIEFSYSGATGPDKWGSLSPTFSACSTGKAQSPIDLNLKSLVPNKKLKNIDRKYTRFVNGTVINNIFNLGLMFDNGVGTASILDKSYTLKQLHWHTPSEHRIDGKQSDAELHMVHVAEDRSVAVIAVLFDHGAPDKLVQQIHSQLELLGKEKCGSHEETRVPFNNLDTKSMERSTKKFVTYVGSLTVPPCTENVRWVVLGKVRSISKEQVAALKAPLEAASKNNSRPPQPLNGREVELYDKQAGN